MLHPSLAITSWRQVIPRSLLFASFDGSTLLFAALGDGHLVSFYLNPPPPARAADIAAPMLSDRKTVSLGSQPVSLVPFVSHGQANVFACSDRYTPPPPPQPRATHHLPMYHISLSFLISTFRITLPLQLNAIPFPLSLPSAPSFIPLRITVALSLLSHPV